MSDSGLYGPFVYFMILMLWMSLYSNNLIVILVSQRKKEKKDSVIAPNYLLIEWVKKKIYIK